jgi:hypothetical protein
MSERVWRPNPPNGCSINAMQIKLIEYCPTDGSSWAIRHVNTSRYTRPLWFKGNQASPTLPFKACLRTAITAWHPPLHTWCRLSDAVSLHSVIRASPAGLARHNHTHWAGMSSVKRRQHCEDYETFKTNKYNADFMCLADQWVASAVALY